MIRQILYNQVIDLINQSLSSGFAIFDDNCKTWKRLEQEILSCDKIIAIRGAGSRNGIDPIQADNLIYKILIPKIYELMSSGEKIIFLYDGDLDIPNKPDIGYVVGRLLDEFNNINNPIFITVQREKWYHPNSPGKNLTNANNQPFVTYVFKQNKYTGEYSFFTQSEVLIQSPKYEQWYVGASGLRADNQLQEFNVKIPKGEIRQVTFYRAGINAKLDTYFKSELVKAELNNNQSLANIYKQIIMYRQLHPFGAHWSKSGRIKLPAGLKHLHINYVL
jgi:hypothetical protein